MRLFLSAYLLIFAAGAAGAQEYPQAREEARVTLITPDGWKLNALFLPPEGNAPVIVLIHSQKRDLSEWDLWFPRLKRLGYGYLAMDLRGHGNSFVAPDGSTTSYRSFETGGSNNEFNKMIRDVEAALEHLAAEGVYGDRTVLVGSILGANLAIKAAAIHQDIAMAAAFSPVLNVNDVLSVNPLRAYGKRPLLMVTGTGLTRQYKEFQLLNDIAKQACGRENVTTSLEAKGFGAGSLVNKYNIGRFLSWLRNPRRPFVVTPSTAPAGQEDGFPGPWEGTVPEEDAIMEDASEYE